MAFRFESLEIWHLSVDYANQIYEVTESFPRGEIFGLTQQIRRAAISVSLNIAEGSGRASSKDFQRFLGMSIGSIFEVITALKISYNRNYISKETYERIYDTSEILARKINAFSQTLISQTKNKILAKENR